VVDPADARELATIAHELNADVLEGALRYPSGTGGWQLGDLDLSEYLDRYPHQRLVLIIAPVGDAEPATYICGVCGFVMDEVGECPRCELAAEAESEGQGGETADILDQVRELLEGSGQDQV
jgi:rubrerythrin